MTSPQWIGGWIVKSNGQVKTVDRGPPSRIQKKIDHGETKSDSYSIMADDGHEDALDVLEDFSGPSIKPRRKSAPLTDSGDEDPNRTLINFQIFSRLPPEIQTLVWNAAAHIPRIVEVHISIDAESWYITCIPALFHVSCEARRAAARVYAAHQQGNYDFEFLRPQILINFAVDTIFLARNFEAYYFLQDIKLEERGRIRSLAIAQDIFSRIRLDNITLAWFGIYPHEMKDLKELIVLAQRRHIHTHPCAWFKTHRREEVLEALWRVKSDLLDSQRRPSIEETRIWQNWGELWALLKNLWKTIEENEGVVRRLYVLRSVAHKFSGEDEAMVFANIERIQWLRRGPRLIYSELLQRKIYTL